MALIKCPECKKQISDTNKKCPKCGYELKKEESKKKKEQLIDKGKNSVSSFVELLKKYKKFIIIGIIIVIFIILVTFVINYINEKTYEKNKNNYPDVKTIRKDVEKDISEELKNIILNDKDLNHKYDSKNIKSVEVYDETSTQVLLKFNYNVNEIISFDIPFIVTYDFDGTNYKYVSIYEQTSIDGYSNLKITDCEKITDEKDLTRNNIIENNYKTNYDSIELKDTKNDDNTVCISTYIAKNDGKYIDRNDTIQIKYTLINDSNKKFRVVSADNIETDVTFDLVGKYSGNHTTRGYFHDKGTVNFEITKVDKGTVYFGSTGKIKEGTSTYVLVAEDGYLDYTDYGYYILNVGYKYGTDASGVDRDLEVRIYDDKLLYYCSYSDESTDGCYEMTKK